MGIREVLQTEIWSKETSRKILARVWKIFIGLKYVGIGLGTIVLVFIVWIFISRHWLTTKERNAGKIALSQVDLLQNFESASDTEFDAQAKRAQEKVNAAYDAAFTGKDRVTAFYLDFYLDQLKHVRQNKKMVEQLNSRPGIIRTDRSKELELRMEASDRDEVKIFRDAAHEILDK